MIKRKCQLLEQPHRKTKTSLQRRNYHDENEKQVNEELKITHFSYYTWMVLTTFPLTEDVLLSTVNDGG